MCRYLTNTIHRHQCKLCVIVVIGFHCCFVSQKSEPEESKKVKSSKVQKNKTKESKYVNVKGSKVKDNNLYI